MLHLAVHVDEEAMAERQGRVIPQTQEELTGTQWRRKQKTLLHHCLLAAAVAAAESPLAPATYGLGVY